jgi:hypothetical protein
MAKAYPTQPKNLKEEHRMNPIKITLCILFAMLCINSAAPAQKMCWTDHGANKIQRANLDGSNVEDLVTTGLSAPNVIALDVAGAKCTGRTATQIKSNALT